MRRILALGAALIGLASTAAGAQTSIAACGPLPDSTARQVFKLFGDLRVCMVALRVGAEDETPRDWAAKAATLVLETQRPDDNRRAVIAGNRVTWMINGRPAAQDSTSERWQKAVLDVLDVAYERDQLRSHAASLQMQIDSLPGRREAVHAKIVLTEARAASLNQLIVTMTDRERTLRRNIDNATRQLNDMERRVASERTRAASERDPNRRAAAENNVRRLEAELNRYINNVNGLERQLSQLDPVRQIALANEELRALRPEHTITLLKLQLAGYDSTDVHSLEREIADLKAPERLQALDVQVDEAVKRLRLALGR